MRMRTTRGMPIFRTCTPTNMPAVAHAVQDAVMSHLAVDVDIECDIDHQDAENGLRLKARFLLNLWYARMTAGTANAEIRKQRARVRCATYVIKQERAGI